MLWCSTSFGMFSKGRYVSLGVSVYQGGCILPPGTLICQKLFVPSTGLDFPFAVPPKGRGGKTANRHSVFKIEMTHSGMYNIHIYFFIFLMEYKILHIDSRISSKWSAKNSEMYKWKPPWMVYDGSAGPTSHLSKVVAQLSTFKKLARLMRQIMIDGISEMRNMVLCF